MHFLYSARPENKLYPKLVNDIDNNNLKTILFPTHIHILDIRVHYNVHLHIYYSKVRILGKLYTVNRFVLY